MRDFDKLVNDEKCKTARTGQFLADRLDNGLNVQLYAVSDFYVEVFNDAVANQIVSYRSFTAKSNLVPYLAHIKFNIKLL